MKNYLIANKTGRKLSELLSGEQQTLVSVNPDTRITKSTVQKSVVQKTHKVVKKG